MSDKEIIEQLGGRILELEALVEKLRHQRTECALNLDDLVKQDAQTLLELSAMKAALAGSNDRIRELEEAMPKPEELIAMANDCDGFPLTTGRVLVAMADRIEKVMAKANPRE